MAVLKANLNLSSFSEISPKKASIADTSCTAYLTDIKSDRNIILTSVEGNLWFSGKASYYLVHVNGLHYICWLSITSDFFIRQISGFP